MRFGLGTLDSGERSLPFGLLVLKFEQYIIYYLDVSVVKVADPNQTAPSGAVLSGSSLSAGQSVPTLVHNVMMRVRWGPVSPFKA